LGRSNETEGQHGRERDKMVLAWDKKWAWSLHDFLPWCCHFL
jgi:hypothetical protein